jgi:D-alanyl-D-alanine-carboxypeptidase/D-alanyl-D-alanine-endopeptidase
MAQGERPLDEAYYNEELMSRPVFLSVTLITFSFLLYAASEEIHGLLVNRVDESKHAVGIVVGVIGASDREVIPYGKVAKDRDDAVNGDTVFELGATTQAFTSLVLADMVERGEVKMDTPVADLLPPKTKVPEWDGRKITLLDLSMHLSALPRMPSNMTPKDVANVYADYTPAKLYEFLSGYILVRDAGTYYEYSNLGAGLLGHALARKAGMSYEQLVRKRILEPLGMNDTSISLTPELKARMAAGYDPALEPAKKWDFDALAGCGALRSTANDLLKFLAANLELTDTPLKAALRRMRSVRHETDTPDTDVMMAWHTYRKYDTEIVWLDGKTAGNWSFIGFDPATKHGAVVLSNTYLDIDDIGLHAINEQWPAKALEPSKHTEIKLDPAILTKYVGEYQFSATFSFKLTLENGHLMGEAPTQPRFELFAEDEKTFFLKVIDAQVLFVKNTRGQTTGLTLTQNGKNLSAVRVH